MIPFTSAQHLVDILTHGKEKPTLNADQAWYLSTRPVTAKVAQQDAWPLRLLPAFLRTPLKARIAARKYERTLIAMWETSPHLLDDIGVVLAPAEGLADHLVVAPAGVVVYVKAHCRMKAELFAAAAVEARLVTAPPPRSAPPQGINRPLPGKMQAGVPA